jgi:Domain of unknown function (DUF4360)
MRMKIFFLLLFITFSQFGFSQVVFKELTHRGTGCPAGTVTSVASPDGSSMSVIFDEFRAEVPQFDGNNDNEELPRGNRERRRNSATVQHKACALSFTATLPPGTKADALELSLQARGATMFDQGIEGSFSAVLIGFRGLAQHRGNPTVVARRVFRSKSAPIDESWIESPRALVSLQSGCSGPSGRDIRFDLKNHITAEISDDFKNRHGVITVDSNDVNGLLKIELRTTPCFRGGGRMAPAGVRVNSLNF